MVIGFLGGLFIGVVAGFLLCVVLSADKSNEEFWKEVDNHGGSDKHAQT